MRPVTMTRTTAVLPDSGRVEHRTEHALRGEVLGRDLARRARMRRVVALDRPQRRGRLLDGREREQTASRRHALAEAGLLRDDGSPGGEKADTAIAEPAAARPHVDVLRDRQLAARALDEAAVRIDIGGDRSRIDERPAV